LLSTVCTLNASSYQGNYLQEAFSEQTELLGAYIFQGDSHGDFRGDYVAVLSDGSQWKVHPDQPEKFQGWNVGDRIHVEVRTSFYWFKREHKFHLYNHNNGEYIKVMLVDYGDQPLVVIDATKPVATDSYTVPIIRTDSNGNIYVVGHREVPCSYQSYVTISDGSVWTISKEFSKFKYGRKVYVGYNESSVSIDPLLISGIEREASWVWTN
ncbi:MAG: hypothetical protein AAGG81_04695, partial [Chlamydiota bacterium]